MLVFDEYFNYPGWQQHEHKAFHEFLQKYDLKCEYIAYHSKYEQVAAIII